MSLDPFVHLHVHTEFSMLDGAAKIDALCAEAARLGQPAVAMTDHGNLYGAYAFYQAARRHRVKPIIGIEAYCAPASRALREPVHWGTAAQVDAGIDVGGKGAHTHLTLLAENATGLRNLFRLSTTANLTGRYRKPRVDRELLAEYADGVIATTGCLGGEVPTRLRLGQHARALEAAGAMRDIFGDRYYLEVMDHGIIVERELRSDLLALGTKLDLTPLATNDSHYVTADQAGAHDALLCVQTGAKITDADRFRFDGHGYHLRSAAEMRGYWDAELPGACDATLAIAERVGDYGEVFAPADRMPRFPLPDGHTADSWLAEEVGRGLTVRYPDGVSPGHAERIAYELGVISAMGFPGYFLVVADLCEHARRLRIRTGPGRGSAAGSLVAYALSITGLDPIVHNLMFERFLNPDRIAPPDIDLDFDERRRGELIAYLTQRWGADRVAQVATFGTIRAKAALRDAARVLGAPYILGDRMSKLLPAAVFGFDAPLAAVIDPAHERYAEAGELRALIGADPQASAVLDTARGLEGLTRQAGVHPSGVILSRDPLVETLPLWAREDGSTITGWDFPVCDEMGLLKVDLLGLRNLTVIEDTVTAVAARRGVHVDPAALPLDDPETFALFGRGDTLGVFQFDSPAIRALLRRIGPTRFADISAAQALYRPGPMGTNTHNEYADRKNRRRPVRPIHPELGEALAPVLGDTYHLLVYQEQVVAAAMALAGYTAAQGDLLRKAMGKKKPEILAREGEKFAAGMAENGFGMEATKAIWDAMVPFAAYAFNRCVAGDTEVWLSATNSTFNGRVTVEDLYRRLYVNLLPPRLKNSPPAYSGPCLHCESEGRPAVWRGRCKACKSWINKFRHAGTSALSLCADGRVRIRRIQDVHFNGMRECFEIELADGRRISATANHRHMTAQGWRRVDQLSVGDALLVVAEEMLKSYQRYDYRLSRGEPIYAGARLPNDQRKRENALRYVDGGSMRLEEWTATQIKECQAPGCMRSHNRGDRIERAHLDGDRTNNDSSNLRMFCVSHHKTWDYANNGRLRRWQAGKPTNPVEIVAIRPVGARPVYDLEMTTDNTETDGPERSWVGNGIITHNSHACSYGMLAYWTAYLKTHYPSEYMAALLTSVSDDKDKAAVYLAEARRLGVRVLPPDVNASGERFAATGEGVRFGLGAVRNVGAAALAKILEAREAGPFAGPVDFCARTGAGRRALEALTRAGAFSALGVSRAGLAGRVDDVLGVGEALRKLRALGEFDLHGPLPVPDLYDEGTAVELDAGEWPRAELLAAEREVLGLYVSGHPLEGLEPLLVEHRSAPVADVLAVVAEDGEQTVTVTGVVTRAECKVTKAGRAWVSATVEDLDAAITILVFRRTEGLAPLLTVDAVVAVRGRLNHRDEEVSVVADQVTVLDTLSGDRPAPVVLDVPAVAGDAAMERLAAVLVEHPGPVPVRLRTECGAVLELTGAGVDASEGFMVAAMAALGEVG